MREPARHFVLQTLVSAFECAARGDCAKLGRELEKAYKDTSTQPVVREFIKNLGVILLKYKKEYSHASRIHILLAAQKNIRSDSLSELISETITPHLPEATERLSTGYPHGFAGK